MGRIQKNEKGFTIVEGLLILVTLVVIAIAGVFVADHVDKKPRLQASTNTTSTSIKSVTSTQTQQPVSTVSMKTFCSANGGLCIKYPSNWKFSNDTSAGTVGTDDDVSILSPSKTVLLWYNTDREASGDVDDSSQILSVTTPQLENSLRVVQAITTSTDPTDSTNTPSYYADYYLTTSSEAQSYKLVQGTTAKYDEDSGVPDQFTYSKGLDTTDSQTMDLDKVDPTTGDSAGFNSVTDIQSWYNSAEVKTAGQILASVYPNPSNK